MEHYPFDSRNELYKFPFGAVAAGNNLRLRLLLHFDAKVHNVYLIINRDGENTFETEMTPADCLDNYRFYECNLSLDEGLYFYSFRYTSDYGEMFVTKSEHSLGTVSSDGERWQLTVYDKDYTTPDWIKGGIIYQIFPDRFYNSKTPKKNVPDDRYIQTNLTALPMWQQTDGKETLGNDYYGGDLAGITEKLPYLHSLGVSCIYLNPIFEAHSNHRYNTADYNKIDSLLGDENDLKALCRKAHRYGINIILDGVFSHTGDDSIYFNKYGRYNSLGAYNSYNSEYRPWYNFENYPDKYKSWWGVPTLPETNENEPYFTEFITGKNGVISHWQDCKIKGWRLDVADELPDGFLDKIRSRVKSCDPDSLIIGEVWEDATNKISHGGRRRFLRGKQLDSIMNYPLCNAILDFVKGENSRVLIDTVLTQAENYPPPSLHALMNHLGTHDTARLINVLANKDGGSRQEQSETVLSTEEKENAKRLLYLAVTLQYTLPGVPSVYYGDEAGLDGGKDPFCRKYFPWDNPDNDITGFYKQIGKVRRETDAFKDGKFIPLYSDMGYIAFIRKSAKSSVFVAVNRWHEEANITLPKEFTGGKILFGNGKMHGESIVLPAYSEIIIAESGK